MIPFTLTSWTRSDFLCGARLVAGIRHNKGREASERSRGKEAVTAALSNAPLEFIPTYLGYACALFTITQTMWWLLLRPQTALNHENVLQDFQITFLYKCGHKSPPASLWTLAVRLFAFKIAICDVHHNALTAFERPRWKSLWNPYPELKRNWKRNTVSLSMRKPQSSFL